VPTSKFGDALRSQVEERLNFFETGAPPSKNADAIRRVLDDLAMEEDDEDADEEMADAEPILTTLEPTPRKEKKKKRKSDAMEVGDDDEGHPAKKVKLSKEEKKALKRAKKEKKEAKKAAAGTDVSLVVLSTRLSALTHAAIGCPKEEEREEAKEDQGIISLLFSLYLSLFYFLDIINCLSSRLFCDAPHRPCTFQAVMLYRHYLQYKLTQIYIAGYEV
jgi:hypothetical protein